MDGQTLNGYVLVLGSLGMMTLVTAVILFVYLYQKKMILKQQAYREIEKLLQKEELKSAYALIEGQEQERKRIAEDLHDNLGSVLATLKIYSDLLHARKHALDGDVLSLAEKIAQLTDQATQETRRVSHHLDSGLLKHFGLRAAVEQLCEVIQKSQRIQVACMLDFDANLGNDISLNVYRIVQELFTNALKHARAERIRLEITEISNDYLSLIFEDNGQGFPTTVPFGMGLQNIRSRVERLRGTFTLDSNAVIGTHIIIEIPLLHGPS